MNSKWFTFFLALIGLLLVLSGCLFQDYGHLVIKTDLDGAEIFIDNSHFGTTKNTPTKVALKSGVYQLSLVLQGYKPFAQTVTIQRGKQSLIEHQFVPIAIKSYLQITTDLDGAEIWLNDSFYGTTKASVKTTLEISPDEYRVVIKKGELQLEKVIVINEGQTLDLTFKLKIQVQISVDSSDAEIFYWLDRSKSSSMLDYPIASTLGRIYSPTIFEFEEPGIYWFYAKKAGRVFSSEVLLLDKRTVFHDVKLRSVTVNEARTNEYTTILGRSLFAPWELEKFVRDTRQNPYKIYVAKFYLYFGSIMNIRGDWAYCQSIHETGWFNFGGDVVPEQNNYAGIGTTGGGVKGHYFNTPEEGVLGQLQHLFAYAVAATVNDPIPIKMYPHTNANWNVIVDPRYRLVKRGSAPKWIDLNGKWAVPGTTYAQSITALHNKLLDFLGY